MIDLKTPADAAGGGLRRTLAVQDDDGGTAMEETDERTVGNTVHYVSYGTPGGEYTRQCRAAIVTGRDVALDEDRVSLAVLNPTGLFFDTNCRRSEGSQTGGTWHAVWNCGGI